MLYGKKLCYLFSYLFWFWFYMLSLWIIHISCGEKLVSLVSHLDVLQTKKQNKLFHVYLCVLVRIGKKSKEGETKTSTYEGISRMICTSKSLNHSLKGTKHIYRHNLKLEFELYLFCKCLYQWKRLKKNNNITVFKPQLDLVLKIVCLRLRMIENSFLAKSGVQ